MSVRIPEFVVPFRYAVTFADAESPVEFGARGPQRDELVEWLGGRMHEAVPIPAYPAVRGVAEAVATNVEAREAAHVEALHAVATAERDGYALVFEGDVPARVEAWQYPADQGQADDLRAWAAGALPVGARVTTTDAVTGTVEHATVAAVGAEVTVTRADGSTLTGGVWEMLRTLTLESDAEPADAGYVVTTAAEGDDRTDGLRRMTLAEATRTALSAEGLRRGARILAAPLDADAEPAATVYAVLAADADPLDAVKGMFSAEADAEAFAADLELDEADRGTGWSVEAWAVQARQTSRRGSTGPRSPMADRAVELAASPFPLGRL